MRGEHCSLNLQGMPGFNFFSFSPWNNYEICISNTSPFFHKGFFFWTVVISSVLVALLLLLALLQCSPHCSQSSLSRIALFSMIAINHLWLFEFKWKLKIKSQSSVTLGTFQILSSHLWLVATKMSSAGREHFRKFY